MVKKKVERYKELAKELIRFYKSSVCGTADSIKALIEIEEKFPTEYKKIREAKIDPSQIDKMMDKMSPKEKDTFFVIFAKASYIAPKLNRVFDLSLEEKKELITTIKSFGDFTEKKLTVMQKPSSRSGRRGNVHKN